MANTVLSTIDDEAITGAFALAVDVAFFDGSAGPSQDIFEFSNTEGTSRIWFGQVEGTNDVEFGIEQDGVIHTVVATDAIVEGEYATWRVGVDPDGTMRIAKNYDLLVEGEGVVPSDEVRESRLVGSSLDPDDADLAGTVINLKIANYGNVDELDPTSEASPCATTGEVRCFCDKLRPDGPVEPGIEGETQISATDLEGDGEWSAVQSLGIIPIHAMVLPDGKIFSFGTDENGTQGAQFVYSLYDPETGVDIILPNTTDTDIFCSSMAVDPVTGNILIMGGDARGEGGPNNDPINDVLVFDYANLELRDATQGEMAYDRWYNTAVTLSNGEIMTIGGTGGGKDRPEVFNSETGWRELTGVDMNINYYYPKTWVTSDDKVIVVPGSGQMYRIDPTGTGSSEALGQPGFPGNAFHPGTMYDVDQVAIVGTDGKIYTADLSADQPVFTAVAQLGYARQEAGMSMLPDGRVIVTGGAPSRYDLENATYTAEIWDPATNTVEEVADAALARLYHSTHLLMPNGMIWVGGGGAPGPLTNTNVEVYAPSYLYDENGEMADRPEITSAPSNVDNDETFQFTVDDVSDIARVTAVRTGALTHAVNSDTRFVELDFTVVDGNTIEVTTLSPGVMVPGSWMLFVLDDDGVPSVASMLGVDMADLVETPNLVPADTGLDVYGIDDDDIDGAFEITVEARFDDVEGGSYQRVFDFGNGPAQDNIILGQINSTRDMFFSVFVAGTQYRIIAPNAIDEGVIAKWTANVDASGYMRLWKDDVLVAEGQGAVPADVDRQSKLVGESNWSADDRLEGVVRFLETVNDGDLPEYVHIGLPKISLVAAADGIEGDAGETGTLRFEVVLDQPAPAIVTADVTVTGAVGPTQVIIPAGQSSAFIDVTYEGNDTFNLAETITVSLDNVTLARVASGLEVSAQILDDDAAGTYLLASFFDSDTALTALSDVDFDGMPIFQEVVNEINEFAGLGSFYPDGPTETFAAKYEGGFWVQEAGEYTFHLSSDDGSALYIDGAQVILNDGIHEVATETATVTLAAGQHQIELRYFEDSGAASVSLEWEGPGFGRTLMDFTVAPPRAPLGPVSLAINEYRFTATEDFRLDSNFVELATEPGASFDGLTLLIINGENQLDTDNVGQITWAVDLTGATSDEDGLLLIGTQQLATFEAGDVVVQDFNPDGNAQTILVVRDFTGAAGDDLDADDDGTLDGLPFSEVVVGLALKDEDATPDLLYSSDVVQADPLAPGFISAGGALQPDGTYETLPYDTAALDTPGTPNAVTPPPPPPPNPDGTGITGRYFVDLDGSRNFSDGDEVVAGAQVRLIQNGVEVEQTTTGADGIYTFDGVSGDGFRVAFEDPNDSLGQALAYITDRIGGDALADSDVIWTDGRGDGTTRKFSAEDGGLLAGIDAGLIGSDAEPEPEPEPEPGDTGISGRYFVDLDGSGTYSDGDADVAGAQVKLILNGATLLQGVTRDDGTYSFTGIAASDGYRVAFENPEDSLSQSIPYITERIGGDTLADSDVIWTDGQGDGTTRKVTVADGFVLEGIDAGLQGSEFNPNPDPDPEPVGDAAVSGRYFVDRDGSQTLTTGDADVADATVWLIKDGATIAQTTTGADGGYLFDGLEADGGYRLAFEGAQAAVGEDLSYITVPVGGAETDSDVIWANIAGNGHTYKFSLAAGSELTGMNAGLDGSVLGPLGLTADDLALV
ncbi:MAG: SdrD B-like domain-containing protein [Pseudomonadota bacterium]